MKSQKTITIDLTQPGRICRVCTVEGDTGSRIVRLLLRQEGEEWNVPDGVTASVAYSKSDGTHGWYDTLPDESPACTVSGSEITVVLAPQMMAVPGTVAAAVVLRDQNGNQLSTFDFLIDVRSSPADNTASGNYYNLQTDAFSGELAAWMNQVEQILAGAVQFAQAQELTEEQQAQARENIGVVSANGGIAVTGAAVGQIVQIAEVDGNGVPTAWEPVNLPENAVTSVNGQTGEVVIEVDGGVSSWNDLQDRPFYDSRTYDTVTSEISEINWDGNTEGLESVAGTFFKVSAACPTVEQLVGGSVTIVANGEEITSELKNVNVEQLTETFYLIEDGSVIVSTIDNNTFSTLNFPTKGTYIAQSSSAYVSNLTFSSPVTFTEEVFTGGELKTIDYGYLPESLWFYPPDICFEYDSDVVYEETIETDDTSLCKVSNDTITPDLMVGKYLCVWQGTDILERTAISASFINVISDEMYSALMFAVVLADSVEYDGHTLTKGIWVDVSYVDGLRSDRATVYNDVGKMIDEAVIPNTIARVSDTEHYTYGTADLTPGTSELATGKLYFVYE